MENASAHKRLSSPHVMSKRILLTTLATTLPLHILGKERIEHELGVESWKKLAFTVHRDFYTLSIIINEPLNCQLRRCSA